MSDALWTLREVTLGRRLCAISLEIPAGITAVLGHSGAGKTSLLNLLVRFERPDAGSVTEPPARGRHARSVFWAPQDDGLWPHLSVRDHLAVMGTADADRLLSEFDLADRANALPHTLSQGERARLAVARTLAADATVLVLDEPLAHVDPSRSTKYWEAIRRHVAGSGASLVFATHAPGTVLSEAQHVICLKQGHLLYAGGVEMLYMSPPTAELAVCFGEANWMEPDEARLWLRRDESVARCFRPEQLAVTPDPAAELRVESARFHGAVAEALLRHEPSGRTRRIWHRPAGDGLRTGARVRLEVREHA